jgi:hypothetical protein
MFKINNWSSFQSYKDRNPPWIRFHKKFIDDLRFQRMSADARALLPMLWLMASEDEDPVSGMLRIGYEEITSEDRDRVRYRDRGRVWRGEIAAATTHPRNSYSGLD